MNREQVYDFLLTELRTFVGASNTLIDFAKEEGNGTRGALVVDLKKIDYRPENVGVIFYPYTESLIEWIGEVQRGQIKRYDVETEAIVVIGVPNPRNPDEWLSRSVRLRRGDPPILPERAQRRTPHNIVFTKHACGNAKCDRRRRAMKKCSRCIAVYYCSKTCQKIDWQHHKSECLSKK